MTLTSPFLSHFISNLTSKFKFAQWIKYNISVHLKIFHFFIANCMQILLSINGYNLLSCNVSRDRGKMITYPQKMELTTTTCISSSHGSIFCYSISQNVYPKILAKLYLERNLKTKSLKYTRLDRCRQCHIGSMRTKQLSCQNLETLNCYGGV